MSAERTNVLEMTHEESRAALRALKVVALASRGMDETERRFLRAAAAALRAEVDLDALAPIEPLALAQQITDKRARTAIVEAMLLMALMDQAVDNAELVVIEKFATALGIDEPGLRTLQHFVDGHHLRLKFDMVRRSYFAKTVAAEAWKSDGFHGLWKAFAPRIGLGANPELAWKYKKLGLLPEGTLGRVYWAHCTERQYDFPGEAHGFEWQVVHDIGHVLGDHDTDPLGELEQAAFEAGYMQRDPFFLLFALTMIFHLEFAALGDNYIGTAKGTFHPERVIAAFQRGLAVKVDITQWDPWPHMARPLDEVRRELNVTPNRATTGEPAKVSAAS